MVEEAVHHIVLIEDDRRIGTLVRTLLRECGYAVQWFRTGGEGLEWVTGTEPVHLVLLDLMLPDMDGLDWCSHIRQHDAHTPILMLTAKAETGDVIRGLERGADDYLTKPFDAAVLLARVRALLRRVDASQESVSSEPAMPVLQRGKMEIDHARHRVTVAGQRVSLTAKEFELLYLLAGHPGHAFNRGQLLNAVWGEEFDGFDHTVNTHINRLRNKIECDPAKPGYILTVWGVGYRFAEADEWPA